MNKKTKDHRKIASRKDLIKLFEKGSLPTAEHFENLIYSNFNKADDNLDISEEHGLMLYPAKEGKLLNFFEDSDDEKSKYLLSISHEGIFFQEVDTGDEKEEVKPEFFIQGGTGNIGMGDNNPKQKLDVNGLVASQGRMGNYIEGELKADGLWYNVFEKDKAGVYAFEVMAYARGIIHKGRYSLLHAIAACTHGKYKISKTCSYYGARYNRIAIRWVSKPSKIAQGIHDDTDEPKKSLPLRVYEWFRILLTEKEGLTYNLQLRTMSNYGDEVNNDISLFYKLSVLWKPDFTGTRHQIEEEKEKEAKRKEEEERTAKLKAERKTELEKKQKLEREAELRDLQEVKNELALKRSARTKAKNKLNTLQKNNAKLEALKDAEAKFESINEVVTKLEHLLKAQARIKNEEELVILRDRLRKSEEEAQERYEDEIKELREALKKAKQELEDRESKNKYY